MTSGHLRWLSRAAGEGESPQGLSVVLDLSRPEARALRDSFGREVPRCDVRRECQHPLLMQLLDCCSGRLRSEAATLSGGPYDPADIGYGACAVVGESGLDVADGLSVDNNDPIEPRLVRTWGSRQLALIPGKELCQRRRLPADDVVQRRGPQHGDHRFGVVQAEGLQPRPCRDDRSRDVASVPHRATIGALAPR